MPMHLLGCFLLAMKGEFQMAVNETIITGRKWRRLIDKALGLWQRISYWTHSSDVEFEDGKTAETKVGAIDGITDSLASNSSRIAASAKAVNSLSNDLGLATRPNPDDPTKAQWRPRGSSGEWQNFCSAQSFTVNLTAGYAQSQTLAFSSSVKFQNAKIKVNIRSFGGNGSLTANVDSKITTIKNTGNYNFEGNVITITANRDASGHSDITSATLDIELSN